MLGNLTSGGSHAPVDPMAIIEEEVDFSELNESARKARVAVPLRHMYQSIIATDTALTDDDLLAHFSGHDSHTAPADGVYSTGSGHRFLADYRDSLESLPGVKHKNGKWKFIGVSEGDDTVPLSELRTDPHVRFQAGLDQEHIQRGSETRKRFLNEFKSLREGDFDPDQARIDLDVFASLPHVNKIVDEPPEPEDIEIKTYQDVLDAQEAVEKDPTVTWEFNGQ